MSFRECRVGDGGMAAGQSKFVVGEDGDEVLEGNGSGRRIRVFFLSLLQPSWYFYLLTQLYVKFLLLSKSSS